jgi:hypothetical protein
MGYLQKISIKYRIFNLDISWTIGGNQKNQKTSIHRNWDIEGIFHKISILPNPYPLDSP